MVGKDGVDHIDRLRGLDLFSGIGGISLALQPWVRSIAYCDSDPYAQAVLLSRMSSGHLDPAPIWDDVRSLKWDMLPPIDIISGGFPCQDISTAGAGAGLEGKRSGLFFEIVRLARDLRPGLIFLENVPALSVRGLERVLLEFTSLGFDSRWTIVSAEEVGAPHIRERWFLLAAHPDRIRLWDGRERCEEGEAEAGDLPPHDGKKKPLADSASRPVRSRLREAEEIEDRDLPGDGSGPFGREYWATEPALGRVADGVPYRVDRIRGLGNAVVPRTAREAFRRLAGLPDGG